MASDKSSPDAATEPTTEDVVENNNADQNTPTSNQSATVTVTVTPPPPTSTPPTTQVVLATPPPLNNAGVGGSSTPKRAVFSAGGSSSGESTSAQKKRRSLSFKTRLIEAGNDADKPAPCWVCKRQFGSWKALFGHMRCHPDRQWRGVFPPPTFNTEAGSSPDQTDKTNHHHQQHQIVLEMNNTANSIIDANQTRGGSAADLPSTLLKLARGCLEKMDKAGPSSGPKRVVFDFDLNVTWEPLESPTASGNSPPPPPPRSPTFPPPPPPGHGLDLDLNKSPPHEE